MSTEFVYLVYGKKSKKSNWLNYCRTDNKEHAYNNAHRLHDDYLATTKANAYIQLVMIEKSLLDEIPDNLKPATYWLDLHMIPVCDMQTHPDQAIYNGGN